jgi:DNA-binding NtrC family response regulator
MKKLLLVDDDTAILKQLSFTFSKEYNVLEASSRDEAFEHLTENKDIDIALIDLGLPPHENSNREGRLIISKLLNTTHAKVLVLTGQECQEYAQEALEMGVFDYIFKPIDMPTLLHAIQRATFFIDNMPEEQKEIRLNITTNPEDGLKASADEAQKQLLTKVLNKTDFNVNQTSKILGISRENCYYFLKKFRISR